MKIKNESYENYFEWLQAKPAFGSDFESNSTNNKKSEKELNIKQNGLEPFNADVVIICAMETPEMERMLSLCCYEQRNSICDVVVNGHIFKTLIYNMNGHIINLAFGTQRSMGMTSATILAAKALNTFNPKLIVMTGICAGVKKKVQLGDVVVGDPVFNYNAGKNIGGEFIPEFHQINLQRKVTDLARLMKQDSTFIQDLRNSWSDKEGKPLRKGEINIIIGPLATGSAVIANEKIVEGIINNQRDVVAIDMESYGIAQAAYELKTEEIPWLVVKGVQDFADSEKCDDCRNYAAHVSAFFALEFIVRFIDIVDKKHDCGHETY